MRNFAFTVLLAALWATILCSAPVPSRSNPIRVLLIDGQSGGPYQQLANHFSRLEKRA